MKEFFAKVNLKKVSRPQLKHENFIKERLRLIYPFMPNGIFLPYQLD